MRICAFSQWPAPTMVFLTRFGAYSATGSPAIAGTSMATPRACPSLRVATASLLTKVASTAASSGACSSTTRRSPSWMATSRVASSALSSVASEPQARKLRRLPSIVTTPQPVRRRPGSMPRMRIGRLILLLDSSRPPARLAQSTQALALVPQTDAAAMERAPFQRHLRDHPARQLDLRRRHCGPAVCGGGRHLGPVGAGARLLRLRLGHDLHAAHGGGVRAAYRRRHLAAGGFR